MKEGQVYKKLLPDRTLFRRIIGLHKGVVVYSRGTDTNGICKVESFERWMRNKAVKLDYDPPSQ